MYYYKFNHSKNTYVNISFFFLHYRDCMYIYIMVFPALQLVTFENLAKTKITKNNEFSQITCQCKSADKTRLFTLCIYVI